MMNETAPFRGPDTGGEGGGDAESGGGRCPRPAQRGAGGDGREDGDDGEHLRRLFVRPDGLLVDALDAADGIGGGPSAEERCHGQTAGDDGGEESRRHEVALAQRRAGGEEEQRCQLSEERGVVHDQVQVGSAHSTMKLIFMLPCPDPQ